MREGRGRFLVNLRPSHLVSEMIPGQVYNSSRARTRVILFGARCLVRGLS
jgi:hypothetical protein